MRYEAIRFARSLCPKFSKDSLTSRLEACSELEYFVINIRVLKLLKNHFIELFGTLKIEIWLLNNIPSSNLSLDRILKKNWL